MKQLLMIFLTEKCILPAITTSKQCFMKNLKHQKDSSDRVIHFHMFNYYQIFFFLEFEMLHQISLFIFLEDQELQSPKCFIVNITEQFRTLLIRFTLYALPSSQALPIALNSLLFVTLKKFQSVAGNRTSTRSCHRTLHAGIIHFQIKRYHSQ